MNYYLEDIKPLTLAKIKFGLKKYAKVGTKDEEIFEEIQRTPLGTYREVYRDIAGLLLATPVGDPAFEHLFYEEVFWRTMGDALTRVQRKGGMVREVLIFNGWYGAKIGLVDELCSAYGLVRCNDQRKNSNRATLSLRNVEVKQIQEVKDMAKALEMRFEVSVEEFSDFALSTLGAQDAA